MPSVYVTVANRREYLEIRNEIINRKKIDLEYLLTLNSWTEETELIAVIERKHLYSFCVEQHALD